MLAAIYQDIVYAFRMTRKSPGFSAVVVLTLALGVGANAAIFSFVDAVLLHTLPFPEPDRLVVMTETNNQGSEMSVSLMNFQDWQARTHSFEEIGAWGSQTFNLTGIGAPVRLKGQAVTWNFFRILRVQPQLGRIFNADEDKYGVAPVVLISDSLWRQTLGADPNILGRSLNLGGTDFTIIGVLPAGFEFSGQNDVWAPLGGWLRPNGLWFDRGNHMGIRALGRLKSGATLAQAESEMRGISAGLEREYPATNSGNGVFTRSLQSAVVREVRTTLLVLMGAVGFVLLIACVNIANLSLARAAIRQSEIAIRQALGARRWRLIRQLLTESLLMAFAGGVAGIFAARWLMAGLLALSPSELPRMADVRLNGRVVLFTGALTLLTTLLFSLFPTWQATRSPVTGNVNQSSRGATAGPARRRWLDGLLVAQVGLALVLLAGAGLMIRTIYKLARVNPGFRADHLLTMRFDLVGPKYDNNEPQEIAFINEATDRVSALPGVKSAAFTLSLPIEGSEWGSVFIVDDRAAPERSKIPSAAFSPVSSGYFQTMEIPLLRGRFFTDADDKTAQRVAVINETMARRFWPNENPIGRRIKQGWPEWKTPWREVVGVVADVKLNGVTQETPLQVYLPLAQSPSPGLFLVLRTQTEPRALNASVEAALHSADPQLPLYGVRTMDEHLNRETLTQRAAMILLSAFALIAIMLAAIGIYGVISWGVVQRMREMGLRMALGAQRRDVLWLVLRRGMLLALTGVVVGLVGALALTRALASVLSERGTGRTPLLFEVQALDPITFIVVPLVLSAIAFIACCLPARRATRVNPMVVLRQE